jgi:hypothetical protein
MMDESIGCDLVTIRQFGDMSEALLAKGCLEAAGFDAFLTDLNIARLDWPCSRGLKLQVKPEDADEALAVLDDSALDESQFR